MARALDSSGYPNYRRQPPAGANPNNMTAAQRRVYNSQFLRGNVSQRADRYGTANPFANSTNNNPYVGIAWLGSGFPHPLPEAPLSTPVPAEFQPLQYTASRPSYDLAGISALLGSYWKIPLRADFAVLVKIREAIPMISAAILRMKELVGSPEIQASPSLKAKIDAFLRVLPVNRMQTGLDNWCLTHLDNMYTYGRAHSEVILNNRRDDIFGAVEVHPATAGLRPTFGGYGIHVVQYQYGGGVPVTLLPELLLSSVNDIRGDDPNGTSLIAELPFVANILNSMLRALGATWDRFGTPTYHVNWDPPDNWEDEGGDKTKRILQGFSNQLNNSLRKRSEGLVNDFMTSGKVLVEILGAQGQELRFEESGRAIMEQICARFGLPPFMYGFSWASTERMSTAQAKMVTEIVESSREVVGPQIERLIKLWQMVTGNGGKFSLDWPKVSLIDLVDQARARAMDAQAEAGELSNWSIKVTAGINSMEEMAQQFRDDLVGLDAEAVRKRLPDLATTPPVIAPPGMGGGNVGEGAGGNNPRDEQTRSWDEGRELVGNGNGRH